VLNALRHQRFGTATSWNPCYTNLSEVDLQGGGYRIVPLIYTADFTTSCCVQTLVTQSLHELQASPGRDDSMVSLIMW